MKHTVEFSGTDHLVGPTSELIKRDGIYTVFIKSVAKVLLTV